MQRKYTREQILNDIELKIYAISEEKHKKYLKKGLEEEYRFNTNGELTVLLHKIGGRK